MEDRLTDGLYMELGDLDPDSYGDERAGELLRMRGVSRVSWWANCVPGRSEFPQRVPEGTLLGIAEVDDDFVAPEPPPGATARHFRRHPRPSQGILTGRPTTGLLVVWISPKSDELTEALRDWSDFVHIRHIAAAAVPGFTQITPYDNADEGYPRFMHLYEMDVDDPEAAFTAMPDTVAPTLGGADTIAYRQWADLSRAGGFIVYVNTFRLVGEHDGSGDRRGDMG